MTDASAAGGNSMVHVGTHVDSDVCDAKDALRITVEAVKREASNVSTTASCGSQEELVEELAGVPVPEQSDPRVTNLGHFRTETNFEPLACGSFTLVRKLASGINGEIAQYRWHRQASAECMVAVKKLPLRKLEQVRGTETDEGTVHFERGGRAPNAEDALTEIGILQRLARRPDLSPYVLRMLGVFADAGHVWLVTEFADGGDLFDVAAAGQVPEALVRRYTWQLLQGLAYLHKQGVGHRDVSLENALLSRGTVKLMDFGMSVRSHSASGVALRYFRAVGKDTYRAPELYVPEARKVRAVAPSVPGAGGVFMVEAGGRYLCEVRFPQDAAPGKASMAEVWGYAAQPADVFSAGVCLFVLGWQCPPWQRAVLADSMFAFVRDQGEAGVERLLRHWRKPLLCPDAMQLLGQMLRPDPAARPSASACLASPWLEGMAGEGPGA